MIVIRIEKNWKETIIWMYNIMLNRVEKVEL
jgi:hypothetical protein